MATERYAHKRGLTVLKERHILWEEETEVLEVDTLLSEVCELVAGLRTEPVLLESRTNASCDRHQPCWSALQTQASKRQQISQSTQQMLLF